MDAYVRIGDEKAIKEAIIWWVEMCPKEEHGIFGECNTWKQYMTEITTAVVFILIIS